MTTAATTTVTTTTAANVAAERVRAEIFCIGSIGSAFGLCQQRRTVQRDLHHSLFEEALAWSE